ncbi:MAG: glucosamine-6-phosphate deaminase [Cryomorphaceae bacterium]|jgi:glucosamine-6-phosphate deaminase
MQRFYSKLVRRSYRTLRHRRIRKVSWLNKIVIKFFNRDLWRPCVRSVSIGLSIGLFCAMLPIPLQMLIAAVCCFIGRGNIPIAIAACWISNPLTQVFLMLFQERVGAKIRGVLDLGWLDFIDINGSVPFIKEGLNLANFAVGVGTTAIFFGIIAFPIVFCFYAVVPKKYFQTIAILRSPLYKSITMNKIQVETFADKQAAVTKLANETAVLIRSNDAASKPTVLGLATGGTPIDYYKALIHLHNTDGLSFQNVITFNLDEYAGLDREHPESYWHFMHQNLFNHIDIKPENINLPSGMIGEAEIPAHCAQYEQDIKDAGGIDLQILGIGRTGHIGFNEPGSSKDSLTRAIELNPITREDAAPSFGGIDNVPTSAITMGCGTILAAKRIVLMAWGTGKAPIVNEAVTGPVNDIVSASYLQDHPYASFYIDKEAAGDLG